MKYFVDDNTVIFSHIKNNILRCTVTREAEARNDSWLVQKNVYRKLHDRVDQKSISINIQSKEAVFKLLNKELFRLNKSILTEKDVVRYSTNGEEPQIEIVKTVDGQRTQISNLRPYIERKAYTGKVSLLFPPHMGISGLGQDEEGVYNRRGTKYYLYQHNMRTPMPFLITDKGYGFCAIRLHAIII